jgi:hypothetical protein
LWQAFLKFIEPFRFIKHFRERQTERDRLAREERHAERTHQQKLLEAIVGAMTSMQETASTESAKTAEGLVAIAGSMAKQAEGFAEWIKLFRAQDAPTTSIIRDEDELADELEAAGMPRELAQLPQEFQLAWALRKDPNLPGANLAKGMDTLSG